MDKDDYKIVKVTNISNFDFNGARGARFDGRDYLIPAGKSMLVPKSLGEHLAKHLAQAILISKAPIRTEGELNGKGSDRPLWDEEAVKVLQRQILSEAYTEEAPVVKTPGEILQDKVNDLNKGLVDNEADNIASVGVEIETESNESGEVVYKDKKEVIAELEARGIKFNPRSTKANLEALLK